jgi:SAM-dependent methyltransferase
MSAHQEREAFEAWVRADTTLHLDRDMRGYADMTTEILWHAWQARAALATPQAEPVDRELVEADRLGFKPVLDACCGSRMFWFDRKDPRAVFVDKRRETHTLPDVSSVGGSRELVIDPDHQADFTNLPFADNTFALVVFDPPHFERNGATGWVGLKYGTLKGDWREMLRGGFAECFRVLRPEGVLIFKWCADEIPVSQILALTPERPLFGHKSGKQQKTHWVTFMKPNVLVTACP